MPHTVKIIAIYPVTHDVNHYRVEKPMGFTFIPGQAIYLSINPMVKEISETLEKLGDSADLVVFEK
ncbi:hypothetical protein [Mucilaginibacter sp.]